MSTTTCILLAAGLVLAALGLLAYELLMAWLGCMMLKELLSELIQPEEEDDG